MVKAREKASLWHKNQKEKRLEQAENEALETIGHINIADPHIVELALSLLYLGEK